MSLLDNLDLTGTGITDEDVAVVNATDNIAGTIVDQIKSAIADAGIVSEDYTEDKIVGSVIVTLARDYMEANPDLGEGFTQFMRASIVIGRLKGLLNTRDVGER